MNSPRGSIREAALAAVIAAARAATCDTWTIPACVALGEALRAYDVARGAACATCDGSGVERALRNCGDGEAEDDEQRCVRCNGSGLIEPVAPRPSANANGECAACGTVSSRLSRIHDLEVEVARLRALLVEHDCSEADIVTDKDIAEGKW